jgi:hypothetical protein
LALEPILESKLMAFIKQVREEEEAKGRKIEEGKKARIDRRSKDQPPPDKTTDTPKKKGSSDQTTTDKATDQTTTDKATDQTTTDKATDQTTTDKATGHVTPTQATTDQATTDQATTDQATTDQATEDQRSEDQIPSPGQGIDVYRPGSQELLPSTTLPGQPRDVYVDPSEQSYSPAEQSDLIIQMELLRKYQLDANQRETQLKKELKKINNMKESDDSEKRHVKLQKMLNYNIVNQKLEEIKQERKKIKQEIEELMRLHKRNERTLRTLRKQRMRKNRDSRQLGGSRRRGCKRNITRAKRRNYSKIII